MFKIYSTVKNRTGGLSDHHLHTLSAILNRMALKVDPEACFHNPEIYMLSWRRTLLAIYASCLVLCAFKTHAYVFQGHALHRDAKTVLFSFGDPSNDNKSRFKRSLQRIFRQIDNQIIFPHDPDTPGLTFTSPIEWAPWMETIWFGNAYEYKSAYFHDVMYSNNVPCKEGALLFRNPEKATKIALLYQRYKKFDQSSYSLSNATFFNIFGAEASLRVGRYKVPLSDELLLCTTDPLTYSEMGRYLNSFNALKWFKSKFFQQKRKRQISISINSNDFFDNAIHFLEYGRIVDRLPSNSPIELPIVPITPDRLESMMHENCSSSLLLMPLSTANSQYFLESFLQSILVQFQAQHDIPLKVLIGGDDGLLNAFAISIFLRVGLGNQIAGLVTPSRDSLLSVGSAEEMMRLDASITHALVLTAGESDGGIRGYFGVKVLFANKKEDKERKKEEDEGEDQFWIEVKARMETLSKVYILPSLPTGVSSLLSSNATGPNSVSVATSAGKTSVVRRC